MAPQRATDSMQEKQQKSLANSETSPLHRVVSFSRTLTPKREEESVSIPILLQDFFGIDYLPRETESEVQNTFADDSDESIPSELSLDEECRAPPEQAPLDLKKKRRSVGKLASRMRERRKHRKGVEMSQDGGKNNVKERNMNEAWIQKQQAKLRHHKEALDVIQQETLAVETRAKSLSSHITDMQQTVAELEQTLSESVASLHQDTKLLQQSIKELKRLETRRNKTARALQETAAAIGASTASRPPLVVRRPRDDDPVLSPMLAASVQQNVAPVRRRADSAPTVLKRASSSFIRVHDLDLDTPSSLSEGSSLNEETKNVFFLDHDVNTVLNALARHGYALATDESDRFVPALSTEKLLTQYQNVQPDPSWPADAWQAPQGKDILVWVGSVSHNGHGCDLPVVKARAILPTAPRQVLELIMDSSRATEYNKMSQGRTDVLVLQSGIDTLASESDYGVAGEAKIIRSLNKPPLIRRSLEMLSLIYARPLENVDGYLAVNRSVWEDSSATPKPSKDTVRSEMMLGVNIFRAVPGPTSKEVYCEITTITHAHAPVVPGSVARKMGPTQAANFLKDLQDLFSK